MIQKWEAPTLYNEAGDPIIASHGFIVVKFADHEREVAELKGLLKEHISQCVNGGPAMCDLCRKTDEALGVKRG